MEIESRSIPLRDPRAASIYDARLSRRLRAAGLRSPGNVVNMENNLNGLLPLNYGRLIGTFE